MLEYLKGKKIAVLGLGVNNQKLVEFFAKHGIVYEVLTWKHVSDLEGRLDSFDIIFRTPGFPFLAPAIQQALAKGVEISSGTKLFFDLCPAPIIGVTGTKGKGTTSSLIAKILEAGDFKVWLAGNIGTDPFEFLDFIHPQDLVVLELSSFQLQDLHKSPHVAVVLNITADHLDLSGKLENPTSAQHASLKEYFDAKMQILATQTENDFAVLSSRLPASAQAVGKGQKIIFDGNDVADYENQLIGKFYRENIAAAVAVGKIYKITEPKIRQAVAQFKGLPHRMQVVGAKNGVTYIDDSAGTNEDTASAAITAIETPLIAIVGGSSKGLSYEKLAEVILKSPNLKGLVVIGAEAPKILKLIKNYKGMILTGAKNMKEIVSQARSMAKPGDMILLSPAAASFDMFKNYGDRGDQFAKEAML